MRHLTSLALAATLLASVMVLPSAAATDPAVGQAVSATVLLPNPTKAALPVTRHQRSTIFVGQQSNGVVSWYFEVDPSTWGGLFDLTSTADTDLDIIFYANPGSLTDPNEGSTVFEGTAGVGEAGIVPVGATYGVVYPAAGFNVPFTYTGYETPTVMLSGDLDITISNGQRVRFVNDTDSYGFVRGEKFTSGDGPADGIPSGDSFTVDSSAFGLFGSGVVSYETHMGSGTITIQA